MNITVLIPTRFKPTNECLNSIPKKIKVLIGVDFMKKGQTKIREELAKLATTKYILILDDDAVIPNNGLNKMLNMIEINNLSVVCGEFNPFPKNKFSVNIVQYKVNQKSFYKTGLTIWNRKEFLKVMSLVPDNCHKYVGDLVLGEIIKTNNIKTFKMSNILFNHIIDISPLKFFKYRYSAGIGLAWYHRKYLKKGYLNLLLKMFFGIPLSENYGMFIYRLSSTLGLIRGLII